MAQSIGGKANFMIDLSMAQKKRLRKNLPKNLIDKYDNVCGICRNFGLNGNNEKGELMACNECHQCYHLQCIVDSRIDINNFNNCSDLKQKDLYCAHASNIPIVFNGLIKQEKNEKFTFIYNGIEFGENDDVMLWSNTEDLVTNKEISRPQLQYAKIKKIEKNEENDSLIIKIHWYSQKIQELELKLHSQIEKKFNENDSELETMELYYDPDYVVNKKTGLIEFGQIEIGAILGKIKILENEQECYQYFTQMFFKNANNDCSNDGPKPFICNRRIVRPTQKTPYLLPWSNKDCCQKDRSANYQRPINEKCKKNNENDNENKNKNKNKNKQKNKKNNSSINRGDSDKEIEDFDIYLNE